jgi:hypothetical protein
MSLLWSGGFLSLIFKIGGDLFIFLNLGCCGEYLILNCTSTEAEVKKKLAGMGFLFLLSLIKFVSY